MRLFALLFLLALPACDRPAKAGADFNPHTQVFSYRSDLVEIDRDAISALQVRAVILGRGSARRYALLTAVQRDGPNFPRIEDVFSQGQPLRYETSDRRYVQCSGGCLREEIGVIHLSAGAFHAMATTGLTFQMIGRRGTYTGTVPPTLFAQALAQVRMTR